MIHIDTGDATPIYRQVIDQVNTSLREAAGLVMQLDVSHKETVDHFKAQYGVSLNIGTGSEM